MAESLPRRVTPSADVLSQELDDEIVLLHLETERYYTLDDVGTRMWQLLAEYGDVATILEHLLAEYDVDASTLRHDLADLIARLAEERLVMVASV